MYEFNVRRELMLVTLGTWNELHSTLLAVGTMAFDVRVGLYDDPPNKDTVKMVQATLDAFALMGKLGRGWENLCYMFFTTPTYRKFCEANDTSFAMSQKIVDNKVAELNKMAEEGGAFDDNQSECNLMNSTVFVSPLARHGWWECGGGICPVVPSLVVGLKLFADREQYIYVIDQGLYCEQSLFSQSSLSSAGLERAKWPRGKLERRLSCLPPASPRLLVFQFRSLRVISSLAWPSWGTAHSPTKGEIKMLMAEYWPSSFLHFY